jgi:hypothetical protein
VALPEEKGVHLSTSAEMSIGKRAAKDLEVTDDRFPGLTFKGTAKSIYEEMYALNPEAFANNAQTANTRSLEKRSSVRLPSLDPSNNAYTKILNLAQL